jgi:hypothetical protein
MNFKEMDNESKIATVMDGRYSRAESMMAREYINALHANDRAIIVEYEIVGDKPKQLSLFSL